MNSLKDKASIFLLSIFGCLFAAACEPKPVSSPLNENSKPSAENDIWAAKREALLKELTSGQRPITDPSVLSAMKQVPRHEFVPDSERADAYDNQPLPIGYGQTISQPYIVAFMTEQLKLESDEKVLEIGTGSGYQAAVLSILVKEVYSMEIIEPLARTAAETLDRLGYDNIFVKAGDGYKGWPEKAPFDAIIVTCAPTEIPEPLVEQLKEGGRMIIPVGPQRDHQELYLMEKKNGEISEKAILPVRFVPMTGKVREG